MKRERQRRGSVMGQECSEAVYKSDGEEGRAGERGQDGQDVVGVYSVRTNQAAA